MDTEKDTKKDQHKAGTPDKPRGQQMGFDGAPDQNREEMDATPALRGRRDEGNKMFADASQQHTGADATTPSTNSPSVPAMTSGTKGDPGGEKSFKERLKQKRERQ